MSNSLNKHAFIEALICNERLVYCAAPLFSPIDRLGASVLAGAVESAIATARPDLSGRAGNYVFLPYRDSAQAEISGPGRAQMIYARDRKELARSAALLARFDGLAKDTGVCVEIGFAHAAGIPIGLLLTDFMWEGACNSADEWPLDPVLAHMATTSLTRHSTTPTRNGYVFDLLQHDCEAVRLFVQECFNTFDPKYSATTPVRNPSVFIDIMGGRYDWARREQAMLVGECKGLGFDATAATRYGQPSKQQVWAGARQDIANARSAAVIVVSGDAPEVDAGSAALFGLATALGAFGIFQYSSQLQYKGTDGQEMRTNLMLEQGANKVTTSVEETISTIRSFYDANRSEL